GSEITVTAIDEGDVVHARAQNRTVRYDSLLAHRQVQHNVREHPRKQLACGVIELASDPSGARHRIDLRLNEIDAPLKLHARVRIDRNGCGVAATDLADLVLKYRRVNPH